MKRYDRTYFDRWYRSPRHRVRPAAELERTVGMALGVAEYVLGRPVRSVLDVGCGEGRWQPVLQRLRPGSRYAGVDSSEYVVRRYGARRNIRLGSFGRLDEVGLDGEYDLVVCADVLHYLSAAEIARGLEALVPHVGGLAYLETMTSADAIAGDLDGFRRRSPTFYRRAFARFGLSPCAPNCWLPAAHWNDLTALERAASCE